MVPPALPPSRIRINVRGVVQGVGFRPYVYRLATDAGLDGHVGNDDDGVVIEVQGDEDTISSFLERLPLGAPPLAEVDDIHTTRLPTRPNRGFAIVASSMGGTHDALVAPDVATCDDCLAELWDPGDRRHRHPFANCTNCGPRFTVVTGVPYDRPNTTMAGFAMCTACAQEYEDPTDRRFHAQPVCCPGCGPTLRLVAADGRALALGDDDPVVATARRLRDGAIVAIKGLGGYHLAVDASDETATSRLRARKHREDRPFALMVRDVDAAREVCDLTPEEIALLTGPERPIVLAQRRSDAAVAPSVAPGNDQLGVMLPYTPVHHLLFADVASPLVMTSGNVSDEPIAHRDDDAFRRLRTIADAFLTHDRAIHTRTDDSVVRVVADRPQPIRRSRGHVPRPVALPVASPVHLLACGAELKNTFCLARGDHAFVSHHVGDLENAETLEAFTSGITHMARLFDVRPEVVVHDLHPEYLSTKHAHDLADADASIELVGVQHHHAHVASCLADNGVVGPVIGVAFDGLGMGDDGTLWGGEVLVADLTTSTRVAHLDPVPVPGGAAAIREPWRMAIAHLDAAGIDVGSAAVATRHADRWHQVLQLARSGTRSPATSSVGRLFDAVSAIVGLRDLVTFEGQAAIDLEQAVEPQAEGSYRARWEDGVDGQPARVLGGDLVRAVVADLADGATVGTIAARFHSGLVDLVVDACERVRATEGLATVALSGGVFQNLLVTEAAAQHLGDAGFHVLLHRQVPCNDGGISLGQAAVAAARLRAR